MIFEKLLKRLRLSTTPRKEPYFMLRDLLGFAPIDMSYYELALSHKSYSNRNTKNSIHNNERLEYLGDAILEAVVSDHLYHQFPKKEEGYLTSLRSKIVQRETLNKIATTMGIDKMMVVPTTHSHNLNIYGNAFEALIGAIYLDQGYSKVMLFMDNVVFQKYIDIITLTKVEQNFKSRLIEWGHRYKASIEFVTLDETKDKDKNIIFRSSAVINGIPVAEGSGYSKRSSHQEAAQKALVIINTEKEKIKKILILNKNGEANVSPAN